MGKVSDAAKATVTGIGLAAQVASGQPTPDLADQASTVQEQQAESQRESASESPSGREAGKDSQQQEPSK